ncbi:FixH family protein [Alteromonas oceanisediminis]|uniref:FixH family protein n=1 Tax=Alteromonas oceanisediminis TaxID=2836180 RepID=UPI001BD94AEE|nr:FixH family protein [Alteromonas oceanisediminis]MBT0586322.1 FixH family protein [Alteromonas oceanisediminis]
MTSPVVRPWYKQFWPWFLIAIPLSSFIVGFTVLHLAINSSDSLVVDDYYKEGRTINARLDKIEQARQQNMSAGLSFADDGSVQLRFLSGVPRTGEAIQLGMYHVTLKDRDITVMLTRDATGLYRGYTEQPLQGKWRVTLLPVSESWKIQQVVALPRSDEIRLTP